ncbi:hypothetical protein D3C81_2165990 [compost metagenome]
MHLCLLGHPFQHLGDLRRKLFIRQRHCFDLNVCGFSSAHEPNGALRSPATESLQRAELQKRMNRRMLQPTGKRLVDMSAFQIGQLLKRENCRL